MTKLLVPTSSFRKLTISFGHFIDTVMRCTTGPSTLKNIMFELGYVNRKLTYFTYSH